MSSDESTPLHYMGNGETTCADAMASMMFGMRGRDMLAMETYWWGCAMKYVWRWPHKNGAEDIEKAIDCLQKLLEEERGCVSSIDAKLKAEPRESIQCTECAHCKQDGVTLFCDCFEDVRCSVAYGSETCERNREKAVGVSFPCEECAHAWVSGGHASSCYANGRWEHCNDIRCSEWCRENAERKSEDKEKE